MQHAAQSPAKQLSQGQQRRLALSRLVLLKRKLWLLDEPIVSLDQQGAQLIRTLCVEHLLGGGMILLASHQEAELSELKSAVLELDHG